MQWWVLLMVLLVAPVQALTVEPFAQAQLEKEERASVQNYRVVVSGLTRTQAATVPNHELRLNGDLWRRVWAVEPQFSLQTVADHFFAQLNDAQTIFQCKALECGSSNFWANTIFANARLVGREQFQHYRVALTRDGNKSTLYVLYVMQRGTRQVMVNLDVFTTTETINAGIDVAQQVRLQLARSHAWLSGFVVEKGQLNTSASQPLINELKTLSPSERARLYLVVQCYEHTAMEKNIECSNALAEQLRAATSNGSKQLNIVGQGALTASPSNEVKPALRFVFWPAR